MNDAGKTNAARNVAGWLENVLRDVHKKWGRAGIAEISRPDDHVVEIRLDDGARYAFSVDQVGPRTDV